MSRFVEHLKLLAMTLRTLGGPGLALLAFIDSSFLPLPEIPDLLLVGLVLQHPDRWPYYAAMATVGSLGGCYVLYAIARAGGHAVLSRYLHDRHIERGLAAFRRYGLLTVIVPSILPPPMPFKPFVLVAGALDVSPATFVLAVIIGRGFRYGSEAILAYWYGPQAMDFVLHNVARASLWFAGALAVVGVAVLLWRQRRPS
jgi:membrane protein YqaA with SNARE-associated domain